MKSTNAKRLRRLILPGIYMMGILGIVGSTGSTDIDFSFPPPAPLGPIGFNSRVSSIAPALDGSDDVYVGGDFTIYKNIAVNLIARLNNDGSLDTGFATGTGFNNSIPLPSVCCDRVKTVVPADDGSGDVYVGGTFTSYNGTPVGRIARLNLDGSLDAGFASGTGFDYVPGTGFFGGVKIIALAKDGSGDVYVGGVFTSYDGTNVGSGMIRLNSDGSLDTGFSTASGWGEDKNRIAPANDGSGDVYVAGNTGPGIARLNSDGSIDTGFDTGPSGFDAEVRAIAVATDGSGDVYVAGYFTDYNGTITNGLARLNNDGSLDAGFVTDAGFVGWGDFITPAIDGSGDIYVDRNLAGKIFRINDDGSIDPGFDHGNGANASIASVAPATDGSFDIYVGGDFTDFNLLTAARVVRLTSNGALVY